MNHLKKISFIIRNNHDEDGLTEEIIRELRSKYDIIKGIVYDCGVPTRDREHGIIYKNADATQRHDCAELHSAKTLALDGSILDAMLPYKSMAMHIMMRETHYDVYERKYLEDVYYRHLQYWYTVLKENLINCILFLVAPHHCGEYIMYSLAKVLDIPMVILYAQMTYKGYSFMVGDSLETLGESVQETYDNIKDNVDEAEIGYFMKGVIGEARNNVTMDNDRREQIYRGIKALSEEPCRMKNIVKDAIRIVLLRLNIRTYGDKDISYFKRMIKIRRRIRYALKTASSREDYERLACSPQNNEKFAYFALQYMPEASIVPLAGEFKNQILSIKFLAEICAPYGVFVYVKEHWCQAYREHGFYEEILRIPNVRLISCETNSLDLIDASALVASQTGNCLLEALIKKKPAIAIGKGCTYKGAPNIYMVNTKEEMEKALSDIINNNICINESQILNYCHAIEMNQVFSYVDHLTETSKQYDKSMTAKKIVEYYERYEAKHEPWKAGENV